MIAASDLLCVLWRIFVLCRNSLLSFVPPIPLLQDEEANDLSKIMMSKKTKRLYGRMQHGIQKKQESIDVLESKRKISETAAAAATSTDATPAAKAKGVKKAKKN